MRLRVVFVPLSVVACVIAATACSGHVTGPGGTRSSGGPSPTAASTPVRTPVRTLALRAPWPERGILPESIYIASQVFDPGTDVLYTLVSRTQAPANGPYVLQATDLRTGAVRRGESYPPLAQLSLVSGYLWVSGRPSAGTPPVLGQVDPETLRTIRSVSPSRVSWASGVAPGPAGSVWVGAYRTLLRISAGSGAVLARTMLPPGLGLSDMAASADGASLYVSAAHLVTGGAEGAVLLEYSARTGELLAETDRTPISDSVVGADLTALQTGVWVSFRTGNLGRSVLLSERALATVIAPVPARTPESIYYWPMFSSSVYGGGALWVTTLTGLVACVNPATGQVRATETVTSQSAQPGGLLVADGTARQVFGFVANGGYNELVSISPSRSCWGPPADYALTVNSERDRAALPEPMRRDVRLLSELPGGSCPGMSQLAGRMAAAGPARAG